MEIPTGGDREPLFREVAELRKREDWRSVAQWYLRCPICGQYLIEDYHCVVHGDLDSVIDPNGVRLVVDPPPAGLPELIPRIAELSAVCRGDRMIVMPVPPGYEDLNSEIVRRVGRSRSRYYQVSCNDPEHRAFALERNGDSMAMEFVTYAELSRPGVTFTIIPSLTRRLREWLYRD